MREIAGLSEIAGEVEGVLLDQFGVLHDGRKAFPEALDAVSRLRAAGMGTVIISNSGKTASANAARLACLGYPGNMFDALLSSGEICRLRLRDDLAAGRLASGTRIFVVASGPGALLTEGLPLDGTTCAEDAELVLIAGRDPRRSSLEDDIARLRPAARRRVPCICANPDLRIYAPDGSAPGPGALAAAYAEAGGPVEWIGKPHAEIFRRSIELLGGIDPSLVLMVGDSLEHDIAGAQRLGCRTLLVAGGVQGRCPAAGEGPMPDLWMTRLRW